MTVNLSALAGAGQQFFDDNGAPLAGGKLYSYDAGTTTPQVTYTSASGSIAHTNPIILNSAGRVSTGEIWLTEGSTYKFVLYDSANVLIASWDNITGINDRDVITSINALNVQYDPAGTGAVATNVQAKFRQIVSVKDFGAVGDGVTNDYAAFDKANSFNNFAVPVGNYKLDSNLTLTKLIAFAPGAVLTLSPGVTVTFAKGQENISPLLFGAVGDGITNDTVAIQAAINSLPTGQTLNGLGLTYLVTSTLNLKANMMLENFVFDFSTAPNSGELLNAVGTIGSEIVITAGLTEGQITFNVADGSSFAADNYVYIKSSNYWDDWDDFCIMAETHRIKTVVGNTITLYDPILYAMPTFPEIQKLTTLDNLTLRNIRAFGSGVGASGDQEGARLSYCKNLVLDNCNFTKFDDRCIRLSTCIDFTVTNGIYGQANKTGLSYGVAIANASINGKISNNTFFDCRHGITLGDDGGPNRYIVVDGNNFTLCREAGMDGHTAADLCVISNNTFQCTPSSAVSDGILWRSVNVTITGNTIIDAGRYGINVTNNVTGATGTYVINDNMILRSKLRGILIQKQHAGDIKNVTISNNTIQNTNTALDFGILLTTSSGYTNIVSNIVVTNNSISDVANRVIVVAVGGAASTLTNANISNNLINSTTFDRGIFVSAATDGNISNIVVASNVIKGTCDFGIRGTNEEYIAVTGNVIRTASTPVLLSATNNVNANNLS